MSHWLEVTVRDSGKFVIRYSKIGLSLDEAFKFYSTYCKRLINYRPKQKRKRR